MCISNPMFLTSRKYILEMFVNIFCNNLRTPKLVLMYKIESEMYTFGDNATSFMSEVSCVFKKQTSVF